MIYVLTQNRAADFYISDVNIGGRRGTKTNHYTE